MMLNTSEIVEDGREQNGDFERWKSDEKLSKLIQMNNDKKILYTHLGTLREDREL